MSEQKFPTPNLDKSNGNKHIPNDLWDAFQADIAIALEAARVEVPEDVLGTIEEGLGHYEVFAITSKPDKEREEIRAEVATARRWLESLRPAPPAEPVEKRCGTCLHWNNKTMFGPRCEGPMPSVLLVDEADMMCGENEGECCQVWEERKNV